MPIGIINFPQIQVPDATVPWANALQSALKQYGNLQDIEGKNYENTINQAKAKYALPMAAADLQKAQIEPDYIRAQIAYQKALAQGVPSEIALRNAQAAAIPSEIDLRKAQTGNALQDALRQNILNQFLPEREKAEIGETTARGNYYNMGGGKVSTGTRDQQIFQNLVQQDNPAFTPDQVREAANVIANGGNQLADGTPVNSSPLTKMQLDRVIKSTTTTNLINSGVKANQAETEIKVLNDYAQKGIQGYGSTYFNKSPQQIYDSLKNDPESQKKLGRLIAARQLQYEIAQNEIKLANGEPGVTQTEELMKLGQQMIDTRFPRLSAQARQEANNYFIDALSEGLKARNKLGIGASAARGNQTSSNETPSSMRNLPEGKIQATAIGKDGKQRIKINGQWYKS